MQYSGSTATTKKNTTVHGAIWPFLGMCGRAHLPSLPCVLQQLQGWGFSKTQDLRNMVIQKADSNKEATLRRTLKHNPRPPQNPKPMDGHRWHRL